MFLNTVNMYPPPYFFFNLKHIYEFLKNVWTDVLYLLEELKQNVSYSWPLLVPEGMAKIKQNSIFLFWNDLLLKDLHFLYVYRQIVLKIQFSSDEILHFHFSDHEF